MEKLSLPELRRLVFFVDNYNKKSPAGTNVEYVEGEMKTLISQSTLDKLAKNCPKLLRLMGVNLYSGSDDPFIYARRMNAAAKFRKVRPIWKIVDGIQLQFDYDSVESCSSDEEECLGAI
jgi:hypothetical protein